MAVNPFQPPGVKDIRTPGTNTAPPPTEASAGLAVVGAVVLGSIAAWFVLRRK